MSSFSSENLENGFDFINVALHTGKTQMIKYLFSNQFPKKNLKGIPCKAAWGRDQWKLFPVQASSCLETHQHQNAKCKIWT